MKARSKKVGVIGIVVAALLIAILIVVDVLCSTYSSLISLYFRGETANAESRDEALKTANEFTEKQVSNGVVLLKNDDEALPLAKSTKKVNMFGALSAKQIYMGTGSAGGFNWSAEDFLNFKTAFSEKGVTVNNDLWTFYQNLTGSASDVAGGVTDMQGSTHSIIDVPLTHNGYQAALDKAKADSDEIALIVVGRAGGEGSDAVMEMNPYTTGGKTYNQNGDAGKHYLELMDAELALVDYVKENYKNVVLLVNSPMPIELGFVEKTANTGANTKGDIDAVLWMGLPGSTGNRGVVNVLLGEESPSGRLPDTWAYEMESAPSYYNFGDYSYLDENGNYISEAPGNNGKKGGKYVHYEESIYIGYRWYETANAEGVKLNNIGNFQYNNNSYETDDRKFGRNPDGSVKGAEQKSFDFSDYGSIVQYSFGSGLTYADFDIAFEGTPSYDSNTNEFTFKVKVTNTHKSVAAKTPVLLYVEQPYNKDEKIEKSKVVLAQFEKTGEIAPGASEVVTLKVNRDELASYDYKTEKAYVLSAGEYKFYADWGKYGSHCWANTADDKDVATWSYNLDGKIVFKGDEKRDSDLIAATNKFDDVNAGDGLYKPEDDDLSRADFAGTFPVSYAAGVDNNRLQTNGKTSDFYKRLMNGSILQGFDAETMKYTGEFADANGNYKDPAGTALKTSQDNGLKVADLTGKEYTDEEWDKLISQMSFADLERLIGYCGWSNPAIMSIGKASAVDMDGCHGLHDLVTGIEANCYATTPITAATFDKKIASEFGATYGEECVLNGVSGMYGFSMNMHRSPFGGRAFEYYSEDGLVAGTMAAAVTGGLQSKGVAVYSKHYAVNDQETNRNLCRTWVSEQAMRELYLRPFEIVTKTAETASEVLHGGTGFMTGMNFIGTGHCSSHYSLDTVLPRQEWGFKGRIVTDAEAYVSMSAAVRAGTDMILIPFAAKFDTVQGMDNTTGYGLKTVQEAAKHQLFVFANTVGVGLDTGLSNAWVAIPVVVSVVLAAGAACAVIFMVVPAFFKKKDTDKE